MSTPTHRIYVGNYTLFRFEVLDQDGAVVDLSGLSGAALEMIFEKPDGSSVTVQGALTTDGTDGRYEYQVTATTFLDVAGLWKRQAHITLSGGEQYWPDIVTFEVRSTL